MVLIAREQLSDLLSRIQFWGRRTVARCNLLHLFLVLPLALSLGAVAIAQDDDPVEFDPATPPTAFSAIDDPSLSDTQQLVLRSIRDLDPVEAEDILEAATTLHTAGLYRDARFLLIRLDQLNLEDQEWLKVVEKIGTPFLLAIANDRNMQPEGRTTAVRVMSAARRAARSPERIQRLIKTLQTDDMSARRQAIRKVRALGDVGVAELLNVFATPERADEFKAVRKLLHQLAVDVTEPVVGAARADNAQVKLEAIRTLAKIESPASTEVLMWSALAPDHSKTIQTLSVEALARRGVSTSPQEIERQFFLRSMRYVTGMATAPNQIGGQADLWTWNRSDQRLKKSSLDADLATRLIAARHASSLYEINPSSKRNRALFLLTQLESYQRMAGSGRPISAEQVADRLNTNAREINTVLSQAVRLGLYPAGVACCQILKESVDESFLYRYNSDPSPLVSALISGDRYLQFAAFDAIRSIDPQRAFVGSSYMLSFAVFLAQGNHSPIALVGHPNPDVARTHAATINSFGLSGMGVTSSRSLFEEATNNPDVEMILISDSLSHPRHMNLVRQLRSDWRTRRLPIALLYEDVDGGVHATKVMDQDPFFVAMQFSTAASQVQLQMRRLITRVQPYRLSNVDRQFQSEVAIDWIAKISRDRKTYRFYDLGNYQAALDGLLFRKGFEKQASEILSSLGSHAAQRQLIDYASTNSLPAENRKQAAAAFARAVNQGGTLLTTDEIKRQYERYNASADEPKVTQEILGGILDTIEARRSKN